MKGVRQLKNQKIQKLKYLSLYTAQTLNYKQGFIYRYSRTLPAENTCPKRKNDVRLPRDICFFE